MPRPHSESLICHLAKSAQYSVAVRERADLSEMDRSLQGEFASKGMVFNKPDPVQFRGALVKAGFYTQWQKTYGTEAWERLEHYTGKLTGPHGCGRPSRTIVTGLSGPSRTVRGPSK